MGSDLLLILRGQEVGIEIGAGIIVAFDNADPGFLRFDFRMDIFTMEPLLMQIPEVEQQILLDLVLSSLRLNAVAVQIIVLLFDCRTGRRSYDDSRLGL